MSSPCTVVLADPQPLVRAAMCALIERLPGLQIVAVTGDGAELLSQVVQHRPDLVVTEVALGQVCGVEALQRMRRHLPQLRLLVVSGQTDPNTVRTVLRLGADGFLSKSGDPAELPIALRAVMRGQAYLSPCVSRCAIEHRRRQQPEDSVILSARQREVLRLIGRGKSTKEIAALLGVSTKTVETHRARVMQTLDLSNINALMHYAVRSELIAADSGAA